MSSKHYSNKKPLDENIKELRKIKIKAPRKLNIFNFLMVINC